MLRTRTPTRILGPADRDAALEVCALHPADNVFVAARIIEGFSFGAGTLIGYEEAGRLTSLCWSNANIVPVETTPAARQAIADKARRWVRGGRAASLLGPAEEVLDLWNRLEASWGTARAVRRSQPHLVTSTPPSRLGIPLDERLRRARPDEVDLVLPAAAHMFTAEIGYPPYRGSSRGYRGLLSALIERGHTYVVIDKGEVVFKADVGSVGLGCAQIQGVWLAPHLRGHGLGTAAMAAMIEAVLTEIAPTATLYVNDFNTVARAMYERIGMQQIGTFATVLL
ncbi:MAG: GNAT family N-acetyltransferase [Tetrasphaera sp.]|nr:GNAT family N-acetyltransferase [Tetrasphaera sp.]